MKFCLPIVSVLLISAISHGAASANGGMTDQATPAPFPEIQLTSLRVKSMSQDRGELSGSVPRGYTLVNEFESTGVDHRVYKTNFGVTNRMDIAGLNCRTQFDHLACFVDDVFVRNGTLFARLSHVSTTVRPMVSIGEVDRAGFIQLRVPSRAYRSPGIRPTGICLPVVGCDREGTPPSVEITLFQ